MLVSIPRAKNYRTYEKNERREKWLDSILKFVAKSNKDDTSPSTVCSWLLQDIHKYYPSVFVEIAVQSGLHVIHKMTAVEAAAMWIDANISFKAAKTIIRHLYAKFKTSIQVPFSQINLMTDITNNLQPEFKKFIFKKPNCETKVGEQVNYWIIDICNLLQIDFTCFMKSLQHKEPIRDRKYGYKSLSFDSETNGVHIILGSDHGAGKSRYLIRTLLCDSKKRRIHGDKYKADYGTRTIEFAEIDCKKDVVEVQALIASAINKAKKEIEDSKLVAVQNKNMDLECVFIPKNSKNIRTEKKMG